MRAFVPKKNTNMLCGGRVLGRKMKVGYFSLEFCLCLWIRYIYAIPSHHHLDDVYPNQIG